MPSPSTGAAPGASPGPPAHRAEVSDLEIVAHHFDQAAERLDLPDDLRAVLRAPAREVTVRLPVRRADGSVELPAGVRVQHNAARGPYAGGVRFHPGAGLDDARARAALATWTSALAGIPFGGAAGGVAVAPAELGAPELEAVARAYVDALEPVLGPTRDVLAPDAGTSPGVMAWMMDEYGRRHGHSPASVTGKPTGLEGVPGREAATGRGLVYLFREAAPALGLAPRDTRVVVQGFGAVGAWAARIVQRLGCTLVGASDASGAVHAEAGLEPQALQGFLAAGGRMTEFPGADPIAPAQLLGIPCEVLIPAALGGMITEENAGEVSARLVLEGACAPTTPAADEILADRGVLVVPDVLAGAGGAIVSSSEWAQNQRHAAWEEREVNDKLGSMMRRAYREAVGRQRESGTSLRTAAYEIAIERVAAAVRTRGAAH